MKNLDDYTLATLQRIGTDTFTERQKQVYTLRTGLTGTKTFQEVADTLGITRQRAKQIEQDIVRKLNNLI